MSITSKFREILIKFEDKLKTLIVWEFGEGNTRALRGEKEKGEKSHTLFRFLKPFNLKELIKIV